MHGSRCWIAWCCVVLEPLARLDGRARGQPSKIIKRRAVRHPNPRHGCEAALGPPPVRLPVRLRFARKRCRPRMTPCPTWGPVAGSAGRTGCARWRSDVARGQPSPSRRASVSQPSSRRSPRRARHPSAPPGRSRARGPLPPRPRPEGPLLRSAADAARVRRAGGRSAGGGAPARRARLRPWLRARRRLRLRHRSGPTTPTPPVVTTGATPATTSWPPRLSEVTFSDRSPTCDVVAGRLVDPYTDTVLDYASPGLADPGHRPPLPARRRLGPRGRATWTPERRAAFSQQLRSSQLLAVSGSANLSKGDSTPASWLPPHQPYRCAYVTSYLEVALAYDLAVTAADVRVVDPVARRWSGAGPVWLVAPPIPGEAALVPRCGSGHRRSRTCPPPPPSQPHPAGCLQPSARRSAASSDDHQRRRAGGHLDQGRPRDPSRAATSAPRASRSPTCTPIPTGCAARAPRRRRPNATWEEFDGTPRRPGADRCRTITRAGR